MCDVDSVKVWFDGFDDVYLIDLLIVNVGVVSMFVMVNDWEGLECMVWVVDMNFYGVLYVVLFVVDWMCG